MNLIPNINEIDFLTNTILNEIEKGKIKLHSLLEKEKISSYWKVGKLISEHVSSHSEQTNYGQFLFQTLSEKLNIGIRTLYRTFQFYKLYQNYSSFSKYLTWSHFRILLTVKSDEKRKEYENIIISKKLTTHDFYLLVKNDTENENNSDNPKLTVFQGIPYIYSLKTIDNTPFIDFGFHIYSNQYSDKINSFEINDLVQVNKLESNYSFQKADSNLSVLYTYKAYIEKIIDGDTLKVNIDLGFNAFTTQTLRLRGINCPELPTIEGIKSRDFVLSKLKGIKYVVIKTYYPDKYSRFLADIFYNFDYDDISDIIVKGIFLNQELLDNNLASRYYIY